MSNKNQSNKAKQNKSQATDSQALVPIKVVNGRKVPDNTGMRTITKAQREEIARLAEADATPAEIAMLLSLREAQVERQLKQLNDTKCADTVSVSVQTRQNSSSIDKRVADKSSNVALSIVQRISELIPEENDISKLATALKVLYGIAQSAEVKTEVTTITSRLRSM
jgi:IS30 family transposase